jgi:hypothetical protein
MYDMKLSQQLNAVTLSQAASRVRWLKVNVQPPDIAGSPGEFYWNCSILCLDLCETDAFFTT